MALQTAKTPEQRCPTPAFCPFCDRGPARSCGRIGRNGTLGDTTMHPVLLLALYCLLIVAASLVGGWLPSVMRLTHNRLQLMVSFVGGLMLGVSLLHLLPHGVHFAGSLDRAVWWMLIGLLVTFFLIRLFHFHQHGAAEHAAGEAADHHDHGHSPSLDKGHGMGMLSSRMGWVGIFIGLSLHTLIDGVAVGAAVSAEAHGGIRLPGLGVFLVVLLHKPLDALSVTSVMAASGWSVRSRQSVNASFALMCPFGAAMVVAGAGPGAEALIGCAMAFSAGTFLCISLGDLLPEVQFHKHDRLKLSAVLVAGIAAAYGIGLFESAAHMGHDHDVAPIDSESPGHAH